MRKEKKLTDQLSGEMIIKQCAPTLAGLKTGSLFTVCYLNRSRHKESICYWNSIFRTKNMRMIPLRYINDHVLLYVYRPAFLEKDLKCQITSDLLASRGYQMKSCHQCLIHLIGKRNTDQEFPHEIGLFLGYPPCDVFAFIENKAKCALCSGCCS